jgi:hypothetical protein
MDTKRFRSLLDRMAASLVAAPDALRGCSETEIVAIEARYKLRLPATYRHYLKVMGHRSGRLFTSDHMAVFYPYVLEMTDDLRRDRLAPNTDGSPPPPVGFSLPADAFVIAGRLGAAWEFIHCSGDDNPAVWHFDENKWTIKQSHPSVLDWLEAWCTAAEEAIASGYYVDSPNGTTP